MTYVRPAPNTDPNNFGTVDRTLDPSMSAATLQSNINAAGEGGVVNWAGSTHYLINTNITPLTGQKWFTNNNRIVKCTNTGSLNSFMNGKTPKGGGPAKTDVFISDLEFWGHANVPNDPPANAPGIGIAPWLNWTLRRVKVKGFSHRGFGVTADRVELHCLIDTCESAYNVNSTVGTQGHDAGGMKSAEHGDCGSAVGDCMKVYNTRFHHNRAVGFWVDIGAAGVEVLACEMDNNARAGIRLEVSAGPFYVRDCYIHHNGGAGDVAPNGGVQSGLDVTSSEKGSIINNTFSNNSPHGIVFTQDNTPPSRSSLSCPALAQPGQEQGYLFKSPNGWFVHGNILLGGDDVNNTTLNSPAIDYSTTVVPDDFAPLVAVTETDTVQPMTPIMGHTFPTLNQVLETDSVLAPSSVKTVAVNQVTEVDSTQPITVGQSILGPLNLVTSTEQALPVTGIKTYSLNQIWEVDTPLALENTGSSVVDVQVVGHGFTSVPEYRKTLKLGTVVK